MMERQTDMPPVSHDATRGSLSDDWRFLALIELGGFNELRRADGTAAAQTAVAEVAEAFGALTGIDHSCVAGRNQIEVAGRLRSTGELERVVDDLRRSARVTLARHSAMIMVDLLVGTSVTLAHQASPAEMAERAEASLAESRNGAAAIPVERAVTALARELERAIDGDQLTMFYQPKVHVRRQEIGSAEALVRWPHPERGLIPPGEFVPIAEQTQIIDRMTLWTISRVIADQRAMRAAGHDLRLFINLSGQLLSNDGFVDTVTALLADGDATLGFEVTETSVIRDPARAIANLQRFADIGITISIDDYGAGLSSLAYLKQLPASELKIDKLFVTQLTSSNRDPLIVRSTIDLAHALELEVVAEGVESEAAFALLSVMGCDMMQGFLISRPIPVDAFISYLDDEQRQVRTQTARGPLTRLASAWKR